MNNIFICSPLNAPTQAEIEQNIRYAEQCGDIVRNLDMIPIVPHVLARFFDDNNPVEREMCIKRTTEKLRECDAMMVSGKRITIGMKHEIAECQKLGIPYFIFYDQQELIDIMLSIYTGGTNVKRKRTAHQTDH